MNADGVNAGAIHGLIIRTNPLLTEPGNPVEVKRSWKERLFTLPWKPLKRTKTIIPQVPSKSIIRLYDGALVMHPEMEKTIKEITEKFNKESLNENSNISSL